MEQLIAAFEALWVKIVAFFPSLLAAVIIFVLALIVTKLTEGPIAAMLRRSKIDIDEVAIKYVNRVVKILIWFIAVIMIMDKLGIPVGSLLTMLAAIGAAVALAIKDNLSNLASGVVLLFTKPFKAGRLHRSGRRLRLDQGNRDHAHLSGHARAHAGSHSQHQDDDRHHRQLFHI